jgi:hypothetical protein
LQLLEESIGETFENMGIGNTFLDRTTLVQEIRAEVDK